MPVPTIEELKEEIYALPGQLNQALGRKAEAEIEVSRLEAEIKKLEVQLKKEAEQKEEAGEDDDGGDTELIEMERELRELETELSSTEGRVNLEHRKSHPKPTDSSARAAVNNNEEVKGLRHKITEQKNKIRTKRSAQRARRISPLSRIPRRPRGFELESPELDSLNEQLMTAENESTRAEVEVETLKAKLSTYQMLVQLIAR